MAKDKVILKLEFERQINGTVSHKVDVDGEGFHFFELIGLLQIICYQWSELSTETAKKLPKDEDVKIKLLTTKTDGKD